MVPEYLLTIFKEVNLIQREEIVKIVNPTQHIFQISAFDSTTTFLSLEFPSLATTTLYSAAHDIIDY